MLVNSWLYIIIKYAKVLKKFATKTDGNIGGFTIMKIPNNKNLMPFLDEDFDIVSPFRSFEENKKAIAEANISSCQLELELELLEFYRKNGVFEFLNGMT